MTPLVSDDQVLGALWGKSNANGLMNLLLQHLLDTAAVAELMWDRFLAPAITNEIDACCGGQGRSLFALVCGLHDVGKASPAFQAKDPKLAEAVRAAGLGWKRLDGKATGWHHTLAGAHILSRVLLAAGWSAEAVAWVVPLVAGHHGVIPAAGAHCKPPQRGNAQGCGSWVTAQDALVYRIASELGIDLVEAAPSRAPRRGVQLAVSGAVIMADWIASTDRQFGGVPDLEQVSMAGARERAGRGWTELRLRGGWDPAALTIHPDQVQARFGRSARAAQLDAIRLAAEMSAPGLLVLEAPMGEGKTEAALAAVEVLAARFGADGLFMGMPTQATSDPMFSRVRRWVQTVAPDVPVGLLHGKRQFNPEWKKLQKKVAFHGVDEFGCDDQYGMSAHRSAASAGTQLVPAEWFLGRKRGLLSALSVGTIDQLLYAATRTRHVMLRHTGLAGRVVVLDEVHAYDVYMAQFLFEALRWLGDTGVPVVVLSATLPPALRADLVRAYLQGALTERDADLSALPAAAGYPNALSACVLDGRQCFAQYSSPPWRPSVPVAVEVLAEEPTEGPEVVVAALTDALRDGGCALVVRNTVRRAQETYAAVRTQFGTDAVLLHARLTVGERADRTKRVLDWLGPPDQEDAADRPQRLVVVATQLAEQSFDVDVDLLVTDVAPIDLLLQRTGRLHRHDRSATDRPPRVRAPRLLVVGMAPDEPGPPRFPGGSVQVYGEYLLLRSAALVLGIAGEQGWSVPADVPDLVAWGYSADLTELPQLWQARATEALSVWRADRAQREAKAKQFLLAGDELVGKDRLGRLTLAGLHERSVAEADDDDVAAAVRDGDESIEVVLVCRDGGGYSTLSGRDLGPDGAAAVSDEDVLEEVARCAVRLPAYQQITEAAKTLLRPLAGWTGNPWLARARALELDDTLSAELGGYRLTYSLDRGLLDERLTGRTR